MTLLLQETQQELRKGEWDWWMCAITFSHPNVIYLTNLPCFAAAITVSQMADPPTPVSYTRWAAASPSALPASWSTTRSFYWRVVTMICKWMSLETNVLEIRWFAIECWSNRN
jgi:hypothetical protein